MRERRLGLVRRYVRDGCTVFGTPVDFNFSVGTENVYSGRLFYIFAALGISALFRLYRAKRCQG